MLTPTLCEERQQSKKSRDTYSTNHIAEPSCCVYLWAPGNSLHLVTCVPNPAWRRRHLYLLWASATLPGHTVCCRLPAGQAVELVHADTGGSAAVRGEPRPAACSLT